MPYHVHGILWLDGSRKDVPTLGRVVGALKAWVTIAWRTYHRDANIPCLSHLWQRNYYEHVVRNEDDLELTREYIVNNPLKALLIQEQRYAEMQRAKRDGWLGTFLRVEEDQQRGRKGCRLARNHDSRHLRKEFSGIVALFVVIATEISLTPYSDISEILGGVEQVMDISVATKDFALRDPGASYGTQTLIDLNQIDFEALQAQFATKHKHIAFEKLRGAVESKLKRMVQLNKSRTDYLERFQRLIDAYNADSENVELYLHELIAFTRDLNQEEQRHISEQLSEEELALFDLLTRPNKKLSEKEKDEVKKVACSLLETLKREKLVLDWRKKQQAKANVQVTIGEMLDRLPPNYTQEVYLQLCTEVFQHVYESYFGQGRSVYAVAS
jgi:hypothetical protein